MHERPASPPRDVGPFSFVLRFSAALDACQVEDIGDGGPTIGIGHKIPHRMARQPGIGFGQLLEILFLLFRIREIIVEPVFNFGAPLFANIGDQTFLEPVSEVEQYGILDDLLEIVAMQHGIDIHGGYALAEGFAQVVVVAVEINKDFVFCWLYDYN